MNTWIWCPCWLVIKNQIRVVSSHFCLWVSSTLFPPVLSSNLELIYPRWKLVSKTNGQILASRNLSFSHLWPQWGSRYETELDISLLGKWAGPHSWYLQLWALRGISVGLKLGRSPVVLLMQMIALRNVFDLRGTVTSYIIKIKSCPVVLSIAHGKAKHK